MSDIRVESALEEVQYRLRRLRECIPNLREKKLVIYGTGINAKRVLDCMEPLNILGLMDIEHTGKYIYGKKVLSEEEIRLLGVDTIIIAAEPYSTEIVYKRISTFCSIHHITILDMYGCDEWELHRKILEQELAYAEMDGELLRKAVAQRDVLFVSFYDVLCSEIYSDRRKIYENVAEIIRQEGIKIPNFERHRLIAQRRVPYGSEGDLKGIYNVLSTILTVDEKQLEHIMETEKRLALENLIPRSEGIDLLKYAIAQNKEVYIYSDMVDGEQVISSFIQQNGIFRYKKVYAEAEKLAGLLGRTIRALGEKYGFQKILCIGNNNATNLIVPQLYGVCFRMIQGSLRMYYQATKLRIDEKYIEDSPQRDDTVKEILKKFGSLFYDQVDIPSLDRVIAEKIGWNGEEGKCHVEIFPLEHFNSLGEIEKLTFPEMEQPMVSIIIPAFNQFEYTYNCLKAILMNTENVTYEVIVADDCSSDFTSEIEQVVSGITVIHNEENMLFIRNCNNAARVVRGKYIMFLNNDTQVQLNWLYPLVACMETEQNVGLAGAKLIYPDGSLQEAGGIVWNNGEAGNYGRGKNPDLPDYNYVREVDYISGAAIIIAKVLWDEIGGFDERYVPAYCEDSDLAFEVRKRGKRVLYQPDSVVVHFEGMSNGKSTESGVKKNQRENQIKFLKKWEEILKKEQYSAGRHVLAACERKQGRKTVLFVSEQVPMYDKDATSRTLDFYIQEFIKRGYIVKFIPDNFIAQEPYTHRLEQMGVEVLSGRYYQKTVMNWIYTNYADIDFAFLTFPNASFKYIDIFKKLEIPVMYYGADLHYIRMQRESELFGDKEKEKESKQYYEKEAYIIKSSDAVYYPSQIELDIVRKEFSKENVRQLMVNFYDEDTIRNQYVPQKREGLLFIGGYRHTPNVDAVMWFVRQIYPEICRQQKIPFYIAGADMPAEIREIDEEGITILGTVTDAELEELYEKVKMVVIPLRYGAGVKGKVVEALYHGVPVVSTSIGMEGIPNENLAVKIADGEMEFAEAVIRCCQSDKELMRMSVEGQKIIQQYYSTEAAWNNIAEDFM